MQTGHSYIPQGRIRSYRFGFNGQEKDNDLYGVGNAYTAEYWEYDTRLGRRWNVDPVTRNCNSPYAAFSNKPTIKTDPNGDIDFYDSGGRKVGTDGNNDTEVIILLDKNDVKKAQRAYFGKGIFGWFRQIFNTPLKNPGKTNASEFTGETIPLPPWNVRNAIVKSVEKTKIPNKNDPALAGIADPVGGSHEEGGYWGKNKSGVPTAVPAHPGNYSELGDAGPGRVEINPGWAADQKIADQVIQVDGIWHVHPNGIKSAIADNIYGSLSMTQAYWNQPPSTCENCDLDNAMEGKTNIVVGAGNNTVYFYNKSGIQATFDYKTFEKISTIPKVSPGK